MTGIDDLHIQDEVLPLFDYTHNNFSKDVLIEILKEQLPSKQEIMLRQATLKGFIDCSNCLKDYSYSRVDLMEVYQFLHNYSPAESINSFKVRLLLSEKLRHQTRRRYIQFVLLLHRLHTYYLKRLDLKFFPHQYKIELKSLDYFLNNFNLTYYDELIREERFKTKHIIELSKLISAQADKGEVQAFWKRYFLFEAYVSISKGILKHGFSFPTFSDKVISIHELYHPLLHHPVKNSFTTTKNVILLTGPNMSGKSTFLKAVSLCLYLGHVGLGVPASKAEMPFFDCISISINFKDDILNGYSHFMTEVINLKEVVMEAVNHKKCFAVFDELFRGTNIEDAVEISSTTIKGLTKFHNSFFFISTHLQQLKELDEVQQEIAATYYISCELKENTPIFTYQLKEGWSDLRVGRILFEKEGLNEMLNGN